MNETTRQKMRVHHIFNVEQLHYVLSTTEYDLTRGMYLPQGNDFGYNLHPTKIWTTEYDLSRFGLMEMYYPQGNNLGYKLHPFGWIRQQRLQLRIVSLVLN